MGKVWLVRHAGTGVLGALKVLMGDPEPEEEERFRREKEVLSDLGHPSIVRLLDFGEDAQGLFIVMEYAPGVNLEEVLEGGRPIDTDRCLMMFADLADGLRHAHDRGIHHRDVKAENVVVREDGWASLVDFGVALKRGASRLTNAGFVMGTLAYLPPEVIQGEPRDGVQGDIYALGQLLCEALTGNKAFRGDPSDKSSRRRWAALTTEKLESPALDPGPGFDEPLRDLVRRATAPEPEDRLTDVGELADGLKALLRPDLQALLEERAAAPPPPSLVAQDLAAPTRSRALLYVSLAAVLLLVVVGCGLLTTTAAALAIALM